jgi:chromosome segregation ATPase
MAKFDGELAGLREAEARARTQALEREASKTAAESELRRAEAKYQRVQIEIRGVMDLARQVLGPAGGDLPPEQAAKLAELQARAAALEPELNQTKATHSAAVAALREAEAEAQRVLSQIRQLDRQKAGAGATLGKQLNERAAGVTEAEKQLRDALAEVARAVLGARGALPVPEATLAQLREHDKQVEARATRLEMHVRALDSYDRDRARQGVIVVLSVLGVVLLSILLKAML